MNIKLIQGQFTATDANELVAQFIKTKIAFHETKIMEYSNEEDIKMREKRIKQLQNDHAEIRKFIELNGLVFNIKSVLEIEALTKI